MSRKHQNTIKDSELAIFCYQFAIVLKSGIPYVEGLHLLSDEISEIRMKELTQSIALKAQEGIPLSECFRMQEVFPVYMIEMITISEETGRLPDVFEGLSKYYQQQDDIKRKLRSSLSYPLVLLGLMFGVITLLIVKIVPIFHDILQNIGGEIPKTTQYILSFSLGIKDNAVWILLGILIIVLGVIVFIRVPKSKPSRDRIIFNSIFTRKLYRTAVTVKFANAMGMLLKSGMNAYSALEMVTPLMDNEEVEKRLREATEKVKSGVEIQQALSESQLFNGIFLKMIQIGIKAGSLEETLEKTSEVYGKEMERSLNRLAVSVEPTLVIILSFIVGAILLLVMMPLIEIMSAIG